MGLRLNQVPAASAARPTQLVNDSSDVAGVGMLERPKGSDKVDDVDCLELIQLPLCFNEQLIDKGLSVGMLELGQRRDGGGQLLRFESWQLALRLFQQSVDGACVSMSGGGE